MACFLVPVAEALIVTAVKKSVESAESKQLKTKPDKIGVFEYEERIPFSRKLNWLTNLLWGGSALLAFEHVWHGEVVPWFPFLTAAGDPAEASVMLSEMAAVGVSMAVLVTAVWCGMLLAAKSAEKRALNARPAVH